jgi:hypothetical protein
MFVRLSDTTFCTDNLRGRFCDASLCPFVHPIQLGARQDPETQVLRKKNNNNRKRVAVPSEKNNKRNQPGEK